MVYVKRSVAVLAAFFEKDSSEDSVHQSGPSRKENTQSWTGDKETVGKSTAPEPELKAQLYSMAQEFWRELLRLVHENHLDSTANVISAAGDNLKNKLALNDTQKVYKRELIATLETLYAVHGSQRGKVLVRKENCTVDSLQRRLRETSADALNAEEALRAAKKERHELKSVRQELEEQRRKYVRVLEKARTDNRELEANNKALVKMIKGLEADVRRLQNARRIGAVEKLREMHKAEMAELVAKQSSLRCAMFHRQLREAEASSHIVHEHVDELERVLDEMRILLTSASDVRENSGSHGRRSPLESLVRKGSKLMGKLGSSLSRRRNETDSGAEQEQRSSEADAPVHNELAEGSSAPKSGSKLPHEPSHPGLSKKLTSHLRHEPRQGEERGGVTGGTAGNQHLEDADVPKSGKKLSRGLVPGSSNKTGLHHGTQVFHKSIGRLRHKVNEERGEKGTSATPNEQVNNTVSVEHGATSAADHEFEAPTSGGSPKYADFKRIISLDSHPEHRSTLQGMSPMSMESMPKTLKSLESNLGILRDVAESKEEEVHRLHRELRAATKISDAFEQGLKREFHKRMEVEKILATKEWHWSKKSKTNCSCLVDGDDASDEITVCFSHSLIR